MIDKFTTALENLCGGQFTLFTLLLKTTGDIVNLVSSGHNHFWMSVSSFVIGWDQKQKKANLAERCWKQEEADFFFFVAAML